MKVRWSVLCTAIACVLLIGSGIWFGFFGDEQENITAGWLMSRGLTPYTDFFFHHAPLPFYISRLFFPFAEHSLWIFRAFMLFLHIATWTYLAFLLPKKLQWASIFMVVLVAAGLPLFLLQMFLADSIASLALVALMATWLAYFTSKKLSPTHALWMTTLCAIAAIWSSITTVLSVSVILLTAAVLLGPSGSKKFIHKVGWSKIIAAGGIFCTIPLAYLLTGQWKLFFWSVFEYNTQYYFPHRLAAAEIDKGYGFIGTTVQEYFRFVLQTGGSFFNDVYIFSLTCKGSLMALFQHRSVDIFNQHMGVAFESLRNSTAYPETLVFVTLIILIVITALHFKKWLIPLILLSITLRSRTNELFHLSPLYVSLWVAVSVILVWTVSQKKRYLAGTLSLIYLGWICLLFPSFFAHITQRKPIIHPEMIARAKQVQRYTKPGDQLLVLGGHTIYYQLTGLLPAARQMYYLPWFTMVPEMHGELDTVIDTQKADAIIIEDYAESKKPTHYAHDLTEKVRAQYKDVGNTIFISPTKKHEASQP